MSACILRSSTTAASKYTDPGDMKCVICMEKIEPSNGNRVTLRCMHAFHGQCICDHLVHDGRCPICRDSPYECSEFVLSEDDESVDEEERISLKDAFKAGKRTSKKDKHMAKMVTTYNKWSSEATTARKDLKALRDKMYPFEAELDAKINAFYDKEQAKMDAFYDKEQAKFDEKHKVLLDAYKSTKKHLTKCEVQKHCAKLRIAKKNGFVKMRLHKTRKNRSS